MPQREQMYIFVPLVKKIEQSGNSLNFFREKVSPIRSELSLVRLAAYLLQIPSFVSLSWILLKLNNIYFVTVFTL